MKPNNKKNNPKTISGQIRIIGGKLRSRKLKVHDLHGLRPTTDRVKETVFNWLMPYIQNAKVLDCFAGSGIFSLTQQCLGPSMGYDRLGQTTPD